MQRERERTASGFPMRLATVEVASERMEEVSTPSRVTLVERLRHGIVSLSLKVKLTTTHSQTTGRKSQPLRNYFLSCFNLRRGWKYSLTLQNALYLTFSIFFFGLNIFHILSNLAVLILVLVNMSQSFLIL